MLDSTLALQKVPLSEDYKPMLTINTPEGLYEFQTVLLGIASAPPLFQAIIDKVLEGIPNDGCYTDDVIITGHTTERCYTTTKEVLKRLSDHNITSKEDKFVFYAIQLST